MEFNVTVAPHNLTNINADSLNGSIEVLKMDIVSETGELLVSHILCLELIDAMYIDVELVVSCQLL